MLKEAANHAFEDLGCMSSLTSKFSMLDHIAEDVPRFGTFSYVDAPPLEHFNFRIK